MDYGLRKPWINSQVARLLCAKTTLRKTAEILGVRRPTVERRLRLFGDHCRRFHLSRLDDHLRLHGGILSYTVQLDELETYETDRRLRPVTVPILIDRHTYFIIHVDTAPLPPRGNLTANHRRKLERESEQTGRRRSGSRAAVRRALEAWRRFAPRGAGRMLQSDMKATYNPILRQVFDPEPVCHARIRSTATRNYTNLLFPINHTNALFRDSISRLVRRTWAASKERLMLERHLWIFTVFRNFVRGLTRRAWWVSSAMALGLERRKWTWSEVLRWRSPFISLLDAP